MEQYLSHHGIKGMRWGVRRFRNTDGSLTEAGKKRYGNRGSEDGKTNSDDPKGQSDRRRVARNVAIGVAAAAAVGSKTYGRVRGAKQRLDSVNDKDVKRMNKIDKNAHSIANTVSDIAKNGKPSNRYAGNHKTLSVEEMANTSDKELQQIINRLNMETNYTRLTEEPSAMERVATGLQYVAALGTIAVSAVTIYSTLKDK